MSAFEASKAAREPHASSPLLKALDLLQRNDYNPRQYKWLRFVTGDVFVRMCAVADADPFGAVGPRLPVLRRICGGAGAARPTECGRPLSATGAGPASAGAARAADSDAGACSEAGRIAQRAHDSCRFSICRTPGVRRRRAGAPA